MPQNMLCSVAFHWNRLQCPGFNFSWIPEKRTLKCDQFLLHIQTITISILFIEYFIFFSSYIRHNYTPSIYASTKTFIPPIRTSVIVRLNCCHYRLPSPITFSDDFYLMPFQASSCISNLPPSRYHSDIYFLV